MFRLYVPDFSSKVIFPLICSFLLVKAISAPVNFPLGRINVALELCGISIFNSNRSPCFFQATFIFPYADSKLAAAHSKEVVSFGSIKKCLKPGALASGLIPAIY